MMETQLTAPELASYIPPGLAERVAPYLPPWLTPQAVIYAAAFLVLVSLAYNLIQLLQRKRLVSRLRASQGAARGMQAELRAIGQRFDADERKIEEQRQLIETQKKLVETSPVSDELKKATQAFDYGINRRYWDQLGKFGNPADDSKLAELISERDEINGLIELTKIKYHTRAIDEKSFSNITEDFQKKLIEIESKIRRMEAKDGLAGMAAAPKESAASATVAGDDIRTILGSKALGMADNHVILVCSKSENHSTVVSTILDTLIRQRGMGGVYISVSRPYETILSMMRSSGIPSADLQFIDCISGLAGKNPTKGGGKVAFVENPSSLEEVSMYLDRALSSLKVTKKFIFLDSLSSMLIYNSDKSVKEFTHFIINRMRLEGIAGVILSIEKKEAEDLVRTLSPMCDTEMRF